MRCLKFIFDVSGGVVLPICLLPKLVEFRAKSRLLFLTSPKGLENFYHLGNLHLLQTSDPAKIKV